MMTPVGRSCVVLKPAFTSVVTNGSRQQTARALIGNRSAAAISSSPRYDVDHERVSIVFAPIATSVAQGCVRVRPFISSRRLRRQIGRASCRERVFWFVLFLPPRYDVEHERVSIVFAPIATSVAQGCVRVRPFISSRRLRR